MRYPLLSVVRTSSLFYATVLITSATGGRGHRTGTVDEREVRMYQNRYHGFLMLTASCAAGADEHLQRLGAESFGRFQRCVPQNRNVAVTCHSIHALQEGRQPRQRGTVVNIRSIRQNSLFLLQLRNFSNAARQLGSSVAIMSSAFLLRERVAQITWLFRENAADLFPREVSHQSLEPAVSPDVLPKRKRARSKAPPHVRRPLVLEKLDREEFPGQLGLFARDVITFLHCLNEFPEFADESLNASILALEGDLKVRAVRDLWLLFD